MRTAIVSLLTLSMACATSAPKATTTAPPADAVQKRTENLAHLDGFIPLHWDEKEGKLLLEIPHLGQELIYQVSLASGVGSNPIGLDRGQLGDTFLVRFEKAGPRVLMV